MGTNRGKGRRNGRKDGDTDTALPGHSQFRVTTEHTHRTDPKNECRHVHGTENVNVFSQKDTADATNETTIYVSERRISTTTHSTTTTFTSTTTHQNNIHHNNNNNNSNRQRW